MVKKLAFFSILLSTFATLPVARATDIVNAGGGVLSQLVSGGTWTTVITLVNLSSASAPYELHFIGNDGQPLTVATTAGTNSVITGNLNSAGSVIIQTTGDPNSPVQQGWAYVITNSFTPIAGSAIFRLSIPGSPIQEASLPLDTDAHFTYGMPVDELTASTGLAIANSYSSTTTNVTLTFYDSTGNQTFTSNFSLAGLAHDSFLLKDRYPQLVGQQGLLLISADYYVNVLGLRANGTGFTSITPLVLQGW